MAEFKPIETQEAFDAAIKDRLERHTKTVTADVTKQYEGYISPDEHKKLTDQINTLSTQLSDLTAKNKAYEQASVKAKVAHEKGIPFELAGKLSGETEEEISADADTLAKFLSSAKHHTQPHFNGDNSSAGGDGTSAALRSMLSDLRKDG